MTASEELTFEDALAKLESIVRELEAGRIKLDDAVTAYTQAVSLKNFCEQKLKDAKLKIEKIETGANGEISVVPLEKTEEQS